MSDDDLSFGNAILKHSQEGKTGTVLISTKNNKACQVILNNGEISAVIMGRLKGLEAVLEAKKVGVKAESFNERQLPFTDDAKINSSDDIIKLIGGNGSSGGSTTASNNTSSTKYDEVIAFLNTDALDAGMPITGKAPSNEERIEPEAESSTNVNKKPVRMYRGQPIR